MPLIAVTVLVTVIVTVATIGLMIIILLIWTYKKKWKLTAAIQNVTRPYRGIMNMHYSCYYNIINYNMFDLLTETDNKPTVLLERDGESDAVFISLQDKPGQLRQALKAFKVSSNECMYYKPTDLIMALNL